MVTLVFSPQIGQSFSTTKVYFPSGGVESPSAVPSASSFIFWLCSFINWRRSFNVDFLFSINSAEGLGSSSVWVILLRILSRRAAAFAATLLEVIILAGVGGLPPRFTSPKSSLQTSASLRWLKNSALGAGVPAGVTELVGLPARRIISNISFPISASYIKDRNSYLSTSSIPFSKFRSVIPKFLVLKTSTFFTFNLQKIIWKVRDNLPNRWRLKFFLI